MLGDDRRRPVLRPPSHAAGSARAPDPRCSRYQLTRSQPLFSPNSAPSSMMAAVRGRRLQRPPGAPFVVRVHDVVVRAVDLVGAGEAVPAAAVLRSEASHVHLPQVHRRLPPDDPLGHHLADTAGAGDAVGTEAGGDEEPGDLALAEDELTVGRERLGPVDELDHVGVDERRHDLLSGLGDRREPVPVGIEERVVERRWDVAVEAPRRRGCARSHRRSSRRPPRGSTRGGRGRASSAGRRGTVVPGLVIAYWWAIGTIGTSTPARRPSSWL